MLNLSDSFFVFLDKYLNKEINLQINMKKDYKIKKLLHILTDNSRTSTKELAKEIGTTQQNASYLVSRLIDEKKIKSFKLLVDSSKFGYNNFCVFLRLKKNSKNFLNTLETELKKYKEIIAIDFLFGIFDIFLKFTSFNASHFNKTFKEILGKFSENIINYKILTQIVLYYYPGNYLAKKKYERKMIMSGDREIINVDKLDQDIINILNNDARINFSYIANKLKVTSKTIISRVKNLRNKDIIKGYGVVLNHKKLNIYRNYILLKFNFENIEIEKKFVLFTQFCPNIIEFIKVFGEWDYLLIVESLNNEDFKKILFEIKENFSDVINDYIFLESEEIELWKYLPDL